MYWTYDNTYCYVKKNLFLPLFDKEFLKTFGPIMEFIDPAPKHIIKSVVYDSYMIEKNDLIQGEFRLLQVDNPLFIPIFTDIRLLITANDVIHSFAVTILWCKNRCYTW